MKFEEAKELAINGACFTDKSYSAIWWIDRNDLDSVNKYSAACIKDVDIPNYRTKFNEYGMTTKGGDSVEYIEYKPSFNLQLIPLYKI